jgi:O-methyltransferase involved in polyketide biosynthesis
LTVGADLPILQQMGTGRIRLAKDKETYLATLYGKALDAAAVRPILADRFAAEAIARIDFDFRSLKLARGGEITLPMRALFFDRWTRSFLAAHHEATVLHLGCGLDTRVFRVDPGPGVRWIDLDLPEVIELRERLYPERAGYQRLGASVADAAWLDAVPDDRPVLVIAEGLTMHLPESVGVALFGRLAGRFASGEIAFDGYSKAMVRLISLFARVGGARVRLQWGIDDPRQLERQIPRLRLLDDVCFLTMPELVARLSTTPWSRTAYQVLERLPPYRRLVRHLRYGWRA